MTYDRPISADEFRALQKLHDDDDTAVVDEAVLKRLLANRLLYEIRSGFEPTITGRYAYLRELIRAFKLSNARNAATRPAVLAYDGDADSRRSKG